MWLGINFLLVAGGAGLRRLDVISGPLLTTLPCRYKSVLAAQLGVLRRVALVGCCGCLRLRV